MAKSLKPLGCARGVMPRWHQQPIDKESRAPMEKRYQVFVSSTYKDLVEERQQVIQALLELDCIPSGMEMFPASSEEQWSLIRRTIDDCDYYLVIVGGRYGSLGADGVSYTEMEYDYAIDQRKPVLGFVHEDPGQIPSGKVELDPGSRAKLAGFRSKVMERMVRMFATPEQLASVVSRSLINLMRQQPAEGWVRGRFAVSQETNEELARLRARVAEFELADVRGRAALVAGAEDLAQGDEPVDLGIQVRHYPPGKQATKVEPEHQSHRMTWDEIVRTVGVKLLNGDQPSASCARAIERLLESKIVTEPGGKVGVAIARDSWEIISNQLQALQIIEIVSVVTQRSEQGLRSMVSGPRVTAYWRLAAYGRELVLQMVALRKGQSSAAPAMP